MIVVTNKLYVQDAKSEDFESLIAERMEFIRDSDCLSFSFERPSDIEMGPSDHYVLRSVWRNMAHLRTWMAGESFKRAHERFENRETLYARENEILFHEIIEAS